METTNNNTPKGKHTQGEWRTGLFKDNLVQVNPENPLTSSTIATIHGSGDEMKANAKLIAEAGNVANQTGLTPMQLLEQRNEMLEALLEIIKTANPINICNNYIFNGLNIGEHYVGACGIPSDKSIHMAVNAIKKATA